MARRARIDPVWVFVIIALVGIVGVIIWAISQAPAPAPAPTHVPPPASAPPLLAYEVVEITNPRIGTMVQVLIAPGAAVAEIRRLDAVLAEKYDVYPDGDGYCIWYMDNRAAAARRTDLADETWGAHCVAMRNRDVGFAYIPPNER